jgi:hypothetical protein
MSGKYFTPGQNRTPQQRRLVRKIIDEQEVTSTIDLPIPKENEKNATVNSGDQYEEHYEEIPRNGQRNKGSIGTVATIVSGVIIGIAAIVGAISYFSDMSSSIAENKGKISEIDRITSQRMDYLESNLTRAEDYFKERISEIKELIKK